MFYKTPITELPDNGNMKLWSCGSYMNMTLGSDYFDGSVAYNVHPKIHKKINSLKPGDLVETAEEEIGLITGIHDKDMQGFHVYKVMVRGHEFFYSAIELWKLKENK